ncbi:MAG: isochorismatase family protein [Alphaproteobacteria bacterium]
MKQRIFMLVDFQNDFVDIDGALSVKNPELIERTQRFADCLQKTMFDEILVTADTHNPHTYPMSQEAKSFPPHCYEGKWGWEQAVQLKDNIPSRLLRKSGYDIWQEEKKYPELQQNWQGKEVYLAGLVSDVCVQKAMDGFLKRGAKVIVFEDLTQGLQKQMNGIVAEDKYMNDVANGNLRLMTTKQFMRSMLAEKKSEYAQRGKIELLRGGERHER